MGVFLHIMHGWGGGLESWVRDFTSGDDQSRHIILKSIGNWGAFGEGILLLDSVDSDSPLRYWNLIKPIKATAIHHPVYQDLLQEVISEFDVTHIIISSLIGHSLDLLEIDRPILHVLHDYYPFCPALNIFFNAICQQCDGNKLDSCFSKNPHNRFFLNVPSDEWEHLRESYLTKVNSRNIRFVAPTHDVRRNIITLYEHHIDTENVVVIAHGIKDIESMPRTIQRCGKKILVVPGRMSKNKGIELIRKCLDKLSPIAEIYFVGCGPQGVSEFSNRPGVKCIEDYLWTDLPSIIHDINPDAALILPTVPETFSYTLSEMWALGIPVIATKIGSLESRIKNRVNGILVDFDSVPDSILEVIDHPQLLKTIREKIKYQKVIRIEDMLVEYYGLLGIERIRKLYDQTQDVNTRVQSARQNKVGVLVSKKILHLHVRWQERIANLNISQRHRWIILSTYRVCIYLPRIILKGIFR